MTDPENCDHPEIEPGATIYDEITGHQLISATVGDDEAVVHMECDRCGHQVDMVYEYADTRPV